MARRTFIAAVATCGKVFMASYMHSMIKGVLVIRDQEGPPQAETHLPRLKVEDQQTRTYDAGRVPRRRVSR